MRHALLLPCVLIACARAPHSGVEGRVAFDVAGESAELGGTPVAAGTELRLTLRWLHDRAGPTGATLAATTGDATIAADLSQVAVTEVREREVLRARVTFREGPVTLEARSPEGVALDRLVVEVVAPSGLRARLDPSSRCAQLATAGDRLSVVPGASTALLDFGFVDASGQRMLGTPSVASACLGTSDRRCLPTSGSRLSVQWSPTPSEVLGGALSTFFTFGLARGTSTTLAVSEATGLTATLVVDDRGQCEP